MASILVEKLKTLPDSKLFEAIASRDLLNNLLNKLCIDAVPEYSPEQLFVEIISDALSSAIADGLSQLDVVTFYHVMVEALDCCGQFSVCIKMLEYI